MSLNSVVRGEVACRNAANKSLLFSPRLFEFPRFAVHTPEGAKRIAASQGGGEYFRGRGPKRFPWVRSPRPGRAKKYSEPSVRPQGGSRIFQLGVTANRQIR